MTNLVTWAEAPDWLTPSEAAALLGPDEDVTSILALMQIGAVDWIGVTEYSELTCYHPDHLRRLLRSGKIKAVHKGNMWWVDRDSLQDYMAEMESLGPKKFDPRGLPHLTSE